MVKNIKPTDKLHFVVYGNQIDYNEEKINSLKTEIAQKYGVPLKNVKVEYKTYVTDKSKDSSMTGDLIDNLQDPAFFLLLCQDYISAKKMEDVDFEAIKTIDQEVNQYIDYNQYSKHKTYKVEYMKWSNYLSFGPDNYFDFTNLHGLVLLNSNPGNQGGKTTFAINLLRFALFGKSPKSPNLNDVFNRYTPEVTTVTVEVGLEIDGEHYVIRRTITRPALNRRSEKSKPKQTLDYFKVNGDGSLETIENCEGESTQQTNNIIKETVGSPDDFDLVVAADKKSLDSLFEKGKTEQGRLFSRWLGLVSIEEKENIAKDIWKKKVQPTLLSNTYNRTTLELEIKDYNNCNEDNNKSIGEYETKKNGLFETIKKLNDEKMSVLINRKEIKEELQKLDISTVENNIKTKEGELARKRGIFTSKKDEYLKVKDSVFDVDKYKESQQAKKDTEKKKKDIELKNATIIEKGRGINVQVEKIKKLVEDGVCPNCSQKIDSSLQNNLIEELEIENNTLRADYRTNLQEIDRQEKEIERIEGEIEKMEKFREDVNRKSVLEGELSALKSQLELIKKEIEELQKKKEEIEQNKDNIKYNNEIDNKVRLIDDSIRENERLKDDCILQIQNFKNNITFNNKSIKEREDIIAKLVEEEKTVRNWVVYQELVGKNGVIKVVLKRALPLLNNEIKRILDGICDFDVVLEIDDKNEISINMVTEGTKVPVEIGSSGFETTFAALAIRSALANISTISRPNCLTLDEIDSTVNPENYDNLRELYNRILGQYQYIFHVCHTAELENMHDMVVTIVKKGHISSIEI